METVWGLLKKLRKELPYDHTNALWGTYLKNWKTFLHKDIYTPMFITALFMVVKTGKKPVSRINHLSLF